MDRLDRDFYAIEQTEKGKRIHVFGYAYNADNGTDTPYRLVEYAFFYIPLPTEGSIYDAYADGYISTKQYLGDYSADGIVKVMDGYFDAPPIPLDYCEVAPDTPCGYYIER